MRPICDTCRTSNTVVRMARVARKTRPSQLGHTYLYTEYPVLQTESVTILYETIVRIHDVWFTVHRNSVWIRKTNYMSLFVFLLSLLIVAQHVSGNHVPIIRS